MRGIHAACRFIHTSIRKRLAPLIPTISEQPAQSGPWNGYDPYEGEVGEGKEAGEEEGDYGTSILEFGILVVVYLPGC
jgi:hypothetical protein